MGVQYDALSGLQRGDTAWRSLCWLSLSPPPSLASLSVSLSSPTLGVNCAVSAQLWHAELSWWSGDGGERGEVVRPRRDSRGEDRKSKKRGRCTRRKVNEVQMDGMVKRCSLWSTKTTWTNLLAYCSTYRFMYTRLMEPIRCYHEKQRTATLHILSDEIYQTWHQSHCMEFSPHKLVVLVVAGCVFHI